MRQLTGVSEQSLVPLRVEHEDWKTGPFSNSNQNGCPDNRAAQIARAAGTSVDGDWLVFLASISLATDWLRTGREGLRCGKGVIRLQTDNLSRALGSQPS